ncbi:MAG: DivIVA domain-containing protein [Fibrobacteria bacterium]|nr:DivIVA domain-containing protein [Fibrobacteria bacterium]
MSISPLDIRKQEFRRKMRGYDPEEVRSYLDRVASELESAKAATAALDEKLKESEDRLGHYRLIERNLQDAAVTVQRALDERARAAEKEAELVVRDAHVRAQAEVGVLNERVARLQGDIANLEAQRTHYIVRLRAVVRSQADLLDALEGETKGEM